MKKLALILALAALGCGGKSSTPSTTATDPNTPTDNTTPTATEPATPGGTPCAQEIALQCAAGVDGCLDGRTTMHVCVAAEEKAGPPCEQEIAKVCPEGQIDACLASPPSATTHVCVYK